MTYLGRSKVGKKGPASHGIIIPKVVMRNYGIEEGDFIEFHELTKEEIAKMDDGKFLVIKIKKRGV